jgi:hypothetical protein
MEKELKRQELRKIDNFMGQRDRSFIPILNLVYLLGLKRIVNYTLLICWSLYKMGHGDGLFVPRGRGNIITKILNLRFLLGLRNCQLIRSLKQSIALVK